MKKYKILIVEDEPQLQQLLGDKMESKGWEIKMALDGEIGLKKIEESLPDLIILDLRMPKIDGFTMLEKLREKYDKQTLPVMILTNYGEEGNVGRAMSLGAETFLIKSNYSLDEIIEKINGKLIK